MVVRVSQMLDEGTQRDEHSALAKAYATARMRETVAWCREALGGNGIVLDYDVARHFADAEALYSYEGTREMNTLIVGPRDHGLRRVRVTIPSVADNDRRSAGRFLRRSAGEAAG